MFSICFGIVGGSICLLVMFVAVKPYVKAGGLQMIQKVNMEHLKLNYIGMNINLLFPNMIVLF